jgi:hypothetical protein
MLFLERLAEQRILEARERGDFDALPGRGEPIAEEPGLSHVPETLRMAYRLMKNAGYVPEEIQLMRSVDDLIAQIETGDETSQALNRQRLNLVLLRLGSSRIGNLKLIEHYYQRLADRLGRHTPHSGTC